MKELAPDYKIVYKSADPQKLYCFSPSILVRPDGRYIASLDLSCKFGKILISDDKGETWRVVAAAPFFHASLFADGNTVYLIGCCQTGNNDDIIIMRSDDNGETWREGRFLTKGETWNHCSTDVWYKDGYVYITLDNSFLNDGETLNSDWPTNIMAPIVLRGKCGTDLTKRENWLFSEKVRFRDIVRESDIKDFGIPFFKSLEDVKKGEEFESSPANYRQSYDFENDRPQKPFYCQASGWLESNIVQITDQKHYWYDPSGKTLHIFMRANTMGTGYACVMKAVERVRDGREVIDIECEVNPSGKRIVFLPFPGGQNKFFVKYDNATKLYWLLSVQARDSMTRIEFLSEDRYNIPCDERDRLALHFSKNMVDWCFAGLVDQSGFDRQPRHYASMDFDGEDMLIVSRSGDKDSKSAHNSNLVTFHRIKNFRDLVY